MENETKTVFVTKYALTQGIRVEQAKFCNTYWVTKNKLFYPVDIFLDRESAVKDAEQRRQKKIASLKKQIEKLENLEF